MRSLSLILVCLLCAGCAALPSFARSANSAAAGNSLLSASHDATLQLLAKLPADHPLDPLQPIIVASLVAIDDLTSSRFGRMVSEQLMTGLVSQGFTVLELKLRDSIYIRNREGELLLSREIPEISKRHAAQAVLVGTYAQSVSNLYVTIKLVGVADNRVISAHDFALPMNSEIRSLLWQKQL